MDDLGELSPASFAMVMATGIVSIALHQRGFSALARAPFALNAVAWLVLWLLTVLRLLRHARRFAGDLIDHLRGPGFFTTVAGTEVLGCQLVLLAADFRGAIILWALAIVLWIGLTYTIFTAFTIKEDKPTLDHLNLSVAAGTAPMIASQASSAALSTAACQCASRALSG